METTRERIARLLRGRPMSPSELAAEVESTPATVVRDVRHVARSLRGTGEELVVAPPRCRECGFDGFDDPANVPSRCPECRGERIDEPRFAVREEAT